MTGSVHAATINIDNGFIYFSQFSQEAALQTYLSYLSYRFLLLPTYQGMNQVEHLDKYR